jgi:hypothetical protein
MNELTQDEQGMLVDAIHDSATIIHKGQSMNERIRKLAKEAGYTPLPGFDFANELQEVFLEKFAELIVRECAEQSMSIGRYNTPSGITPDLAIAISVGLKKHFGVES